MSASFKPDSVKLEGLEQFLKAVKYSKDITIKLGILGQHVNREPEKGEKNPPTNAEVGAAQEYGGRSFLRMPMTDHLKPDLEKQGVFKDEQMKKVIKLGSILPWAELVANLAVGVVKKGFDNGGWGKWKQWAPGYKNRTGKILVDTTQLREAITSEVVEK